MGLCYVLIHVRCILGGLWAHISGHCNGEFPSCWGATASHVLQNDEGGGGHFHCHR